MSLVGEAVWEHPREPQLPVPLAPPRKAESDCAAATSIFLVSITGFLLLLFLVAMPDIERAEEMLRAQCYVLNSSVASVYCCETACPTCTAWPVAAPTCDAVTANVSAHDTPINSSLSVQCDGGPQCCQERCSTCSSRTCFNKRCSTRYYRCDCVCSASVQTRRCSVNCGVCYEARTSVVYDNVTSMVRSTHQNRADAEAAVASVREGVGVIGSNGTDTDTVAQRTLATTRTCFYSPQAPLVVSFDFVFEFKRWFPFIMLGVLPLFLSLVICTSLCAYRLTPRRVSADTVNLVLWFEFAIPFAILAPIAGLGKINDFDQAAIVVGMAGSGLAGMLVSLVEVVRTRRGQPLWFLVHMLFLLLLQAWFSVRNPVAVACAPVIVLHMCVPPHGWNKRRPREPAREPVIELRSSSDSWASDAGQLAQS